MSANVASRPKQILFLCTKAGASLASSPGQLEEVKQAHERLCQMAQKAGGKPPEPFDESAWLRTAKRTALRSKPYILQEAAQQCKELAVKAGWLEVQLQEVKKTVA